MNRASRRLIRSVETLVGDIGTEIGVVLVPATPVDTGFARGNWLPSLNAPAASPITFLDPTGAATIARIGAVASQYRVGDVMFIVNSIDYIGALNAGSSVQAEANFVRHAVVRGTRIAIQSFGARRNV